MNQHELAGTSMHQIGGGRGTGFNSLLIDACWHLCACCGPLQEDAEDWSLAHTYSTLDPSHAIKGRAGQLNQDSHRAFGSGYATLYRQH